jgi:hypothetical protein
VRELTAHLVVPPSNVCCCPRELKDRAQSRVSDLGGRGDVDQDHAVVADLDHEVRDMAADPGWEAPLESKRLGRDLPGAPPKKQVSKVAEFIEALAPHGPGAVEFGWYRDP